MESNTLAKEGLSIRYRPSSREWVMSYETFNLLDPLTLQIPREYQEGAK